MQKSISKSKEDESKCFVCKKKIILKGKSVCLSTYKDADLMDATFFHFDCWTDFYQSKIDERHQEVMDALLKNPLVANILGTGAKVTNDSTLKELIQKKAKKHGKK